MAAYAANKDAPELPVPAKKKPLNDILKRNMESAVKKNMEMKKPNAGTMGKPTGGGPVNIDVKR